MTDPLTFPSTTARYSLPLLFAGQAQKEVTVNGAHALTDMLLHAAIEGEASLPPAEPLEGDCWLVGPAAGGAFAGREGQLACYQQGTWLFVVPRAGLLAFDCAAGQFLLHSDGWRRAPVPAEPSGGATVDQEAREGIRGILATLRNFAILPPE